MIELLREVSYPREALSSTIRSTRAAIASFSSSLIESTLTTGAPPRQFNRWAADLSQMTKLFGHWWQACLLGLLVGIPAGILLEFARRAYNDAATERVVREFESKGMSPPLMIDFLQPWVVPILTAIIFALVALLFYAIIVRVRRVSRSTHAA